MEPNSVDADGGNGDTILQDTFVIELRLIELLKIRPAHNDIAGCKASSFHKKSIGEPIVALWVFHSVPTARVDADETHELVNCS